MKRFADLHLLPELDEERAERLVCKASELGYSLVGVSLHPKAKQETMLSLKTACKKCGVDVATRVDLTPRSSNELLKSLRQLRRKYELISVNCFSKLVARQAAKDNRVDLLSFPSDNPHQRFFDNAEAKLASQGVAALEISMAQLLGSVSFSRARFLSYLRREIETARKFRVPVVISSSAHTPLQLRGPHDFANIAFLFGMDDASALKAVSAAPSAIVRRNRGKLDSNYVAKGIRVVRRGKNCDN